MKILVTGTAGFIGFHLALSLLDAGHDVFGYDNFNSYYSVQLKRDRHALLENRPCFRGEEADLCDAERLLELCSTERFEVVCHLAAQAGVRYSLKDPHAYEKSNLQGFLNVLEAVRQSGIGRLVYASSSSVYGGNKKLPFSESDRVDSPVSLYAATKKANELMAHSYSHLFGFHTIGLRFFTVYGPWGRPDMAMWTFTESMLAGEPIQVFNHGLMERDFTYIDDIIKGVTAAIFYERPDLNEVFNLGNNRPEKLMDMISVLADSLGVEAKLNLLPMQPGDVTSTYADISRSRIKLGFEPSTKISVGIPKFVAWFKWYHDLA